jgi:hypothetical protein
LLILNMENSLLDVERDLEVVETQKGIKSFDDVRDKYEAAAAGHGAKSAGFAAKSVKCNALNGLLDLFKRLNETINGDSKYVLNESQICMFKNWLTTLSEEITQVLKDH